MKFSAFFQWFAFFISSASDEGMSFSEATLTGAGNGLNRTREMIFWVLAHETVHKFHPN